jgi:integrase
MAHRIDIATGRAKLEPRREPYWSKIRAGLYVGYRKTATGPGTWIARRHTAEGKHRYHSLGDQADFNTAVEQVFAWTRAEEAREAEARSEVYTVADACRDYLDHLLASKGKTAADNARGRIAKRILPTLGSIPVDALTTDDLYRWRDSLIPDDADDDRRRAARDTANRLRAYLRAALTHAYKRRADIPSDRAWKTFERFKKVGAARKVFLSKDEAKTLLDVCTGGFRDLVEAALLTGARYGELGAARVEDFDANAGVWRIRKGKTGPRDCYLNDQAVDLFKRLTARRKQTDFIFVKDDTTPWVKSDQRFLWREARESVDLDPDATFYACRHTHVSWALIAGLPIQMVAENVGTSVQMITQHYGKFTATDRRELINRVTL